MPSPKILKGHPPTHTHYTHTQSNNPPQLPQGKPPQPGITGFITTIWPSHGASSVGTISILEEVEGGGRDMT